MILALSAHSEQLDLMDFPRLSPAQVKEALKKHLPLDSLHLTVDQLDDYTQQFADHIPAILKALSTGPPLRCCVRVAV